MREREFKAIAEWRKYLRFWGRDVQRDIDDELRFHLEMRERDFVASGMTSNDAHDATLQRFGSVDEVTRLLRAHDIGRERSRQRVEVFETLAQDVRYGIRKLLQAPGFTVAVVLVLALGIGINSAIFSAVDAALLRPLPFRDAERLASLGQMVRPPSAMRINGAPAPKRAPDTDDVAAMGDVIEAMGSYAAGGLNLSGGGEPVRVKIALATPSLFPMLGATPALGRTFVKDEGSEHSNVVILSYGIWRRQYGGDSSVIGRTVLLNGSPYSVVGVMGKKFVYPAGTDLWMPLKLPFEWKGAGGEAFHNYLPLRTLVKVKPGVDALTAGKRVRALFAPYATEKSPLKYTAEELVLPLQETIVKDRRKALLVLMGAAALVLLTACANVTNLLLARAAARRREIEIRAALGASRTRIVQQLLTESVLLSMAGGLLGIAFAFSGLRLLTTLMPPQLVDLAPPTIDARVLGFSLLLAMVTGLLFGLWPAFGAARTSSTTTSESKRSNSTGATARDGRTLRSIFVVSEMAFALMLLIGAGLMLRSFRELLNTDSGVQIDRVATLELTLPQSRYANGQAIMSFYNALMERMRRVPGVTNVAVINELPLRGETGIGLSVEAEGATRDPDKDLLYPKYLRVTPEYFQVMGIQLRAGRALNDLDNPKQPVAVINQAMADALWPGQSAVGKRFALGTMPGDTPSYITVVGVIANVRSQSIDTAPTSQLYLPFSESPELFSGVIARGAGDPQALLAGLQSAVRAVDATQPIYNLQTLDQAVSKTIAPRRTNTLLIATFGLLAVVLAAFGVYAVIGYGVSQRTREIGIRIALGAGVGGVLRMVLREGLVLGLVGVVVGLGGAWALSRILESMLYGVSARDPFTFVAAPLLLIGITAIATLIPARTASRVDPVRAIRTE